MATILNPHYRTTWIQNVLRLDNKSATSKEIFEHIKQLWLDWLDKHHQQQKAEDASYERRNERRRRETTQLLLQVRTRTIDSMSERIFGDWTIQEPVDAYEEYLQEYPIKERVDCLQWWSDPVRKDRWPQLSEFAVLVLSFPPMSDEAERIFSGARRTISWERSRLAPDIIEAMECYHHFLKRRSL